jgi:hypothetical protein
MATATAKTTHFPCKFGNLNVGDEVCRIGIKIDRVRLKLNDADKSFCSKRITCKLIIEPGKGETPQIAGMEDHLEVKGVFDTKSFGVSRNSVSAGLTANIASIDMQELVKFAKREGRIEVLQAQDLDNDDDDEDDDDDQDEDKKKKRLSGAEALAKSREHLNGKKKEE